MRACPYCAEQIQDAAIVCRFCGRDVASPRDTDRAAQPKPRLPGQRWYGLDKRVRSAARPERDRRGSIWARIGEAVATGEARASRPRQREEVVREYLNVREYQADVDRMLQLGWKIERQVEERADEAALSLPRRVRYLFGPRAEHVIIVTWVREPPSA